MAEFYEIAAFINNYGVGTILLVLVAVVVVNIVQPIFER